MPAIKQAALDVAAGALYIFIKKSRKFSKVSSALTATFLFTSFVTTHAFGCHPSRVEIVTGTSLPLVEVTVKDWYLQCYPFALHSDKSYGLNTSFYCWKKQVD